MTEAVTPDVFRRLLGRFATGVTIVSGFDDEGAPVGFACQSFCSVSLEPPLVLFCADHRGRSWPRMRAQGRFSVAILDVSQDDLISRFGLPFGRKFDELRWQRSGFDTPIIPGHLGAVHCELRTVVPAGDHDVVIGRVLGIDPGTAGRPMIYYRGDFTRLADSVAMHAARDDL